MFGRLTNGCNFLQKSGGTSSFPLPLLTPFFSYIPTPLEVVPLVELLVSGGA